MPLGSLTKRLRRSRSKRHGSQDNVPSSSAQHIEPEPEPEPLPLSSVAHNVQLELPEPAPNATQSAPMQMPTPMLATFQVPDISAEAADVGDVHPTAETGTVNEPVEELAQLQEAIERRYSTHPFAVLYAFSVLITGYQTTLSPVKVETLKTT